MCSSDLLITDHLLKTDLTILTTVGTTLTVTDRDLTQTTLGTHRDNNLALLTDRTIPKTAQTDSLDHRTNLALTLDGLTNSTLLTDTRITDSLTDKPLLGTRTTILDSTHPLRTLDRTDHLTDQVIVLPTLTMDNIVLSHVITQVFTQVTIVLQTINPQS